MSAIPPKADMVHRESPLLGAASYPCAKAGTGWILHKVILRTAMFDFGVRRPHWTHGRRTHQPETGCHPRGRRRRLFPADGIRRGGHACRFEAAPANGL